MSLIGITEIKKKLIGKIHLLREIPGFSAYELAVKHGFEGTEEEYLASLSVKGDPGKLESHTEVDALGHRVINVAEPVQDTDGATKKYVDDKFTEVEDITEKFCSDVEGTIVTDLSGVYKQGKVINGVIYLDYGSIIPDNAALFTIAEGYRPKGKVAYFANCPTTNVYMVGAELGGFAAAGSFTSQHKDIEISFTYICE